ncbi:hypothetical protein LNP74_32100 [Klebsiella pneumoniae subsp. pneumoniae]|nr:hypothetical protein [Klebsiella pneumoniae subsp. pneumoniae]
MKIRHHSTDHCATKRRTSFHGYLSALDFSLSDAEITELEVRYLPHPVDGIIPRFRDTPPSLTPPSAIQNC